MIAPDWIWIVFIFAFGCCIGSFLNVVIYRLPRDKSLVSPPSACPTCGKYIQFYDNIPLFSWLLLHAKCRNCKASISPQYFAIDLLTCLVYTGLFYVFCLTDIRTGIPSFLQGGWLIYLVSIILLGAFIAVSVIDMQLWVIPISVCWFVTAAGLAASAFGGFLIDPDVIRGYALLPNASAATASLALGAAIGLGISMILLATGLIKRSYEAQIGQELAPDLPEDIPQALADDQNFNHRAEICKEIIFLLPIILCSLTVFGLFKKCIPINNWWIDFSQKPLVAGLLGSLWGYFVGCGVVWATRIFGTLGFGKEAMGLGDVHLMGAAGSVIGPVLATAAFFIAPFFGLVAAAFQMFFKKVRQIPYGPFLSLGTFVVMIFHDRVLTFLISMFYH